MSTVKKAAVGCSAKAFDGAAKYGQLNILEWLCAKMPQGSTTSSLRCAALGGQLQVVQYLTLAQSFFLELYMFETIAKTGQFSVLEWFLKHYQSFGKFDNGIAS